MLDLTPYADDTRERAAALCGPRPRSDPAPSSLDDARDATHGARPMNGTRQDGTPGDVLRLWLELRKQVGVLKARTKEKVNFKVRSADELMDKIRGPANELGLLIYPVGAHGHGETIANEDRPDRPGTLAMVAVTARVQALSDGSYFEIAGYGLGADQQDKAGGKAGTYAWKQALVQALLAGGNEDTDDDGAPMGKKGVRKVSAQKFQKESPEAVAGAFEAATDAEGYRAAFARLTKLAPDAQLAIKGTVAAAKTRIFTEQESKA